MERNTRQRAAIRSAIERAGHQRSRGTKWLGTTTTITFSA